jgi:dephospho-CoA kinase
MLVVGLTGGVGMGKSTVAEYLRSRGEELIDTDEVAREVTRPGSEALGEIAREIGPEVLAADGSLNRGALAARVFGAESQRKALERILHPRIRQRWLRQIEEWRAEGKTRAIVVIPLLFETGAQGELGRVICVGCTPRVQMTRLMTRGWSREQAQQRIAAQWPIERKMDLADGVIWNEGSVEMCLEQAARLFGREAVAPVESGRRETSK